MAYSFVTWRYRDAITWSRLLQMRNNVLDHDHRSDGSQGSPRGKWAAGDKAITHGAGGIVTSVVTFPAGRFSTPPNVVVERTTAQAAHDGHGVHSITATQCTVWSSRTNAGAGDLCWIAREAF